MNYKIMKKIYILLFISYIAFLSWCSNEELDDVFEKNDYLIDIKQLWSFDNFSYINKSWRLDPINNIDVISDVNWRLLNILVKEWQKVLAWDLLARISDINWVYTSALQNAENELNASRIRKEEQLISLNKIISDFEIALRAAKNDHELLTLDLEKQIKELNIKKSSVNLLDENSPASLNLSRLEQEIEKAKLDYENLLLSDNQQKRNFIININNNYNSFKRLLDEVIHSSDVILWVTNSNRHLNDSFEIYLWARNSSLKSLSENMLLNLISIQNTYKSVDISNVDYDYLLSKINYLNETSNHLNEFIVTMDLMLKASVSSSDLPQSVIDWYISQYNNLRNQTQQFNSSFSLLSDQIKSFFETYMDRQLSIKKSISSLEIQLQSQKSSSFNVQDEVVIWYERQILQLRDRISNSEISLERAKNNLNNALENKNVAIKSLDNAINRAQIAYNDALRNYNKLNVYAPISWVITEINSQVWQNLSIGNIILQIWNSSSQEVVFWLSLDELNFVSEWMIVKISDSLNTYDWIVYSVSSVADQNLNYSVRVRLDSWLLVFWNIVNVSIPIEKNLLTLPINLFENIDRNSWFLYVYEWWKVERIRLEIWEIVWQSVTVLSELPYETYIVLSSLKNFNENDFVLKANLLD